MFWTTYTLENLPDAAIREFVSMAHLILLGDSIFDNSLYVPGGPALVEQVRRSVPPDCRVTLLAVDGHTTGGTLEQLKRLPGDATHLIVSVGGNDGLQESSVLGQSAITVSHALVHIHALRERFRENYRKVLEALVAAAHPAAVCTVYNAIPGLPEAELAALGMINEVILFEAFRARLPVLDLRLICNEAADYSEISAIEPSTRGGLKIARVIADYLAASPSQRSIIYS
jgi:hypothetical protein